MARWVPDILFPVELGSLGGEVIEVVLRVLLGHHNPQSINKTFIVLIQKVSIQKELG
jgi:hypothetical protein